MLSYFSDTFAAPPGTDLSAVLTDSGHTWTPLSGSAGITISPTRRGWSAGVLAQFRANFATDSTKPVFFDIDYLSDLAMSTGPLFNASPTTGDGFCVRLWSNGQGSPQFEWYTFASGGAYNHHADTSVPLVANHIYRLTITPGSTNSTTAGLNGAPQNTYTVTAQDLTAHTSPATLFGGPIEDSTFLTGVLGTHWDGPGSATAGFQALQIVAGTPTPSTISLTGPTTGLVGVASGAITVALDQPAPTGGQSIALSSPVGGDTFAATPLVIPAGQQSGTFTIDPATAGTRTITASATGLTSGTLAYTATSPAPPVPELTLNPTSATIAPGSTLSLTATRTGSTAALGLVAPGGTPSTSTPTSGVAFGYLAGMTLGSYPLTVTDPTDGLTAICNVTIANIYNYDSGAQFATGATVAYQVYQGTTPVGSPVSVAEFPAGTGDYFATVALPSPNLAYRIVWTDGQRTAPDIYNPAPVASGSGGSGMTLAQFNSIAGFNGWTFPQMQRAVAAFLLGRRTGVPASGAAGTVTYSDPANSTAYGTVTVDTLGNITGNAMTPPA